jgi:tryptophan synthase alpha chain
MSRLTPTFAARQGRMGLVPYLTAGYPSLAATLEMLRALAGLGVLAVEVGVPFSDPIADGPEIQRAAEWSVRGGVGAAETLEVVAALRRDSELPVVLMTYANPILRPGIAGFAAAARAAGVDGIIVSDLPPEESPEAWEAFDREGLDTVMLVAPTTPPERLPLLAARSRGFVYCLARTGVTGRSSAGYRGALHERIAQLRAHTPLPVAVGFGISTPDQVRALQGLADAVIVGAAFMRAVSEDPLHGAEARVLDVARRLSEGLGQAR